MPKILNNGFLFLKDFRIGKILKPLAFFIPLAIAGNVTYILLVSRPHILKDLIKFRAGYLILAVILAFVPWLTHTLRLLLWSRAFQNHLKPIQALKTAVATDLGNAITPTSTGGGYFKLGFLIGHGFAPGEAALITFLGTIEDALFFLISLPVALILSHAWDHPYVTAAFKNLISYWPVVVAVIVLIVIGYIIFIRWGKRPFGEHPEIDGKRPGLTARIRTGFHKYLSEFILASRFVIKSGKITLGICTILAGIGWSSRYGAVSALILGLGFNVNLVLFFLLQWVVFSTMILVPTPGAIGGAEMTFAVVFSGTVPGAILPILIGAWRFVTFYMPVGTGAIIMAISGAGRSARSANGSGRIILEEIKS
jgi:uncharacterized protein (TIRG00374 family)